MKVKHNMFYLSGKICRAYIDTKNAQGAFLVAEKMGRVHF